jgi:hypothetical protein
MNSWALAALGVVLWWTLVWMIRVGVTRLTAQLAVLTVVTHEVLDKVAELDEELHAVADGAKES